MKESPEKLYCHILAHLDDKKDSKLKHNERTSAVDECMSPTIECFLFGMIRNRQTSVCLLHVNTIVRLVMPTLTTLHSTQSNGKQIDNNHILSTLGAKRQNIYYT